MEGKGTEGEQDAIAVKLNAITQSIATITAPLEDDVLQVRFKKPDGTIEPGEIVLGVTIQRFEEKVERKKHELEHFWSEWEDVQQQIVELSETLLTGSGIEGNRSFATEELDDAVEKLEAEIEDAREQSLQEVEKEAREEAERAKRLNESWLKLLKSAA